MGTKKQNIFVALLNQLLLIVFLSCLHVKNNFAEVFRNLDKSENNCVVLSK